MMYRLDEIKYGEECPGEMKRRIVGSCHITRTWLGDWEPGSMKGKTAGDCPSTDCLGEGKGSHLLTKRLAWVCKRCYYADFSRKKPATHEPPHPLDYI